MAGGTRVGQPGLARLVSEGTLSDPRCVTSSGTQRSVLTGPAPWPTTEKGTERLAVCTAQLSMPWSEFCHLGQPCETMLSRSAIMPEGEP